MNTLCKHMSFGIVLLSLSTNNNTHGMSAKLLKKSSNTHLFKHTYHTTRQCNWRLPERFKAKTPEDTIVLQATLNAIKDLIVHKDGMVRYHGYDLLKTLIAKDYYGTYLALEAAKNGTKDENSNVHVQALALYGIFVKQDIAPQSAVNAASNAMINQNDDVRNAGIKLYTKLFKKKTLFVENYILDFATKTAAAAFLHEDAGIRNSALQLFTELFAEKYAFKIALDTANIAFFQKNNDNLAYSALNLFDILVKNNYGHESAIKAAVIGQSSKYSATRILATSLFNKLKCHVANIE